MPYSHWDASNLVSLGCIIHPFSVISLLQGPTRGGGWSPSSHQVRSRTGDKSIKGLTLAPRDNWDIFKYRCLGGKLVKTPHRIKKNLCCGATLLTSATCTLAHHVPKWLLSFLATVHVHFVSLGVKGKKLPMLAAFSGFIFCLSSWVHWLVADCGCQPFFTSLVGKKNVSFSS